MVIDTGKKNAYKDLEREVKELRKDNGNCTNLFCTHCLTDYLIADYVC